MGIDRIDYIIYGFKMKPNDLKSKGINIHDDKFLPYIEGHPGVKEVIVYDYMSGEYVVFGKLVCKSDESSGFEFINISYRDFFDTEEATRVIDKFYELFGCFPSELNADEDPSMFVFSHFS